MCGWRITGANKAAFYLFDDNRFCPTMRKALAHNALLDRTLKAKRLRLGHMQRLVTRCIFVVHSVHILRLGRFNSVE
jgi:hypothetical protein